MRFGRRHETPNVGDFRQGKPVVLSAHADWAPRGNDERAPRVLADEGVQIETFSGDYVVMHHVRRAAIRHVFTAEELAAADRSARAPRRRA